jgi:hypothetical protein
MANANVKLQCTVCIQALQLDMAKPSDNVAEFVLTSVASCKQATQDDAQKLLCLQTLLKNADQLVMDQKNGVAPMQSCMNLGLACLAPTAAPTTAAPTTAAPITAAPTTAAPKPTPPLPPRVNSIRSSIEPTTYQTTNTDDSILVPVAISAGAALIISLALWFYRRNKKEAVLQTNDTDFHAMPDIEYSEQKA